MWRRWSRALEWLGRIRVGGSPAAKLRVGHPGALDALGGWGWRQYLGSEQLYDVWGPHPDGPWVPFHCVPLFAALDRLPRGEIGPLPPPEQADRGPARQGRALALPVHARPGAPPPAWLGADSWIIVDLPGPESVEVAAWLVTVGGCQPVCTFDNWPHPRGTLQPEHTLAALLSWATRLADERRQLTPASPPLWICDSDRLGERPGTAGEFDNRYFLDDSILPAPTLLRRHGVARVIYLAAGDEVPVLDLESYFTELLSAGLPVLHVDIMDSALEPHPFAAPPKPRRPSRFGFRRSAAGGFGTEVPEPSSGGSS